MDPYEKLCTKDPRYPMFNDIHGGNDEKPTPRQGCACDNCFYGSDAMALEIIRLREALEKIAEFPHAPDAYIVAQTALKG